MTRQIMFCHENIVPLNMYLAFYINELLYYRYIYIISYYCESVSSYVARVPDVWVDKGTAAQYSRTHIHRQVVIK